MLTITKHLLSVKFFQGTPTSRSRWVGHLKSRFRAEKDLTDLQQIFLELTDNKSSCSNQPVMSECWSQIEKKQNDILDAKQQVKSAKADYKHNKTEAKRKAYETKKKKVERLQEQLIKLEVQATDKVWGPRHLIVKLVCCRLGAAWLGALRGRPVTSFKGLDGNTVLGARFMLLLCLKQTSRPNKIQGYCPRGYGPSQWRPSVIF